MSMRRLCGSLLMFWCLAQVIAVLLVSRVDALLGSRRFTGVSIDGEATVIAWVCAWVVAQSALLSGGLVLKRYFQSADCAGRSDGGGWTLPAWQRLNVSRIHAMPTEPSQGIGARWRRWIWLGAAPCVGVALQLGLHGLSVLLQGTLGMVPPAAHIALTEAWQSGAWPQRALLGACITVFLPLIEETVYRGWLFDAARQSYSAPREPETRGGAFYRSPVMRAALFTSAAFAFLHIHPLAVVLALPAGLVLVWVRLRSESLAATVIAHGISNALALIWVP